VKVYVPSALRSYPGQNDEVDADGETLGESCASSINASRI
jgi:hypothetical protein